MLCFVARDVGLVRERHSNLVKAVEQAMTTELIDLKLL